MCCTFLFKIDCSLFVEYTAEFGTTYTASTNVSISKFKTTVFDNLPQIYDSLPSISIYLDNVID